MRFSPLWLAALCVASADLCFAPLARAQKGGPLIVPGKSIGQVSLGTEETEIVKQLGEPTTFEGAAGRHWTAWFAPKGKERGDELDIYCHVVNDTRGPVALWIRVESPYFHTAAGVNTRSGLAEIWREFPNLRYGYTDSHDDAVEFYADKSQGILVEVRRTKVGANSFGAPGEAWGVCRALIVYSPEQRPDGSLPDVRSMRDMPDR